MRSSSPTCWWPSDYSACAAEPRPNGPSASSTSAGARSSAPRLPRARVEAPEPAGRVTDRRLARPRSGCTADPARRPLQEEPMHAVIAAELAVEGHREHLTLASGHGLPVDLRENLDLGAVLGDPGRSNEHPSHRTAL